MNAAAQGENRWDGFLWDGFRFSLIFFVVVVVVRKGKRKGKKKYVYVCIWCILREWEREEEISDVEGVLSHPVSPKVPVVLKFIQQAQCFLTFRIWLRQQRLRL